MVKQLETERLLLCPPSLEDAEAFHHNVEMNDDLFKYTPGLGRITELEQTKRLLESWTKGKELEKNWIVKLRTTNEIIGMADISIDEKDRTIIEIGYALASNYWGKGYGTEVAKALVDFCFEDMNCKTIRGKCDVENIGSRKVMENAGLHVDDEITFKDRKWYILSLNKDEIKKL